MIVYKSCVINNVINSTNVTESCLLIRVDEVVGTEIAVFVGGCFSHG